MLKIKNIQKPTFQQSGIITSRELNDKGLSAYYISKLVEEGVIERVKRGLYIFVEANYNEYQLAQKMVPNSIYCSLSAAAIYNYTTHIPNRYHLAIKSKDSPSLPAYPPIKLYYWKKQQYELGITSINVNGISIKIYDKEKTVCDFIKFRNKLDKNIVKEVIKTYLKKEYKDLIKLKVYSKKLRIETILNNYLDILL